MKFSALLPSYASLVLLLLLVQTSVNAQSTSREDQRPISEKEQKKVERRQEVEKLRRAEEEGAIIYNKQTLVGAKLLTDGWSGFLELGRMKSVEKTRWYSLEIGERKHPKEEKLTRGDGSGFFFNDPVIYGKQNNFFYLKLGLGEQRLIGGKGNRNGVAVSAVYGGGLSVGLLKPYYIKGINAANQELTIKYTGTDPATDSLFLDETFLFSRGGLFKGFNELKIKPGIYTKTGLRFDYGRFNELISAIEAGINAEFYLSDMPIMAGIEPKKFFLGLYVSLDIGRRK